MAKTGYKYLDGVSSPEDIKKYDLHQLQILSEELRDFMVSERSANPGHLGSSMGAVELTMALHYVSITPEETVAWV